MLSFKYHHPLFMLAGAGVLLGTMGSSSAQTPLDIKAPVGYASQGKPVFVAAGDVNGDGKADLVTANSDAGTVGVLIGRGDGTFNDAASYPSGGVAPVSIAVGDFNGDGKADLAVANSGGNTLGVLINKGDGTFNAATLADVGGQPGWVAAGDLNGDNKPDLVVVRSNSNQVATYLSNGDGTFTFKTEAATGTGPQQAVVNDFTSDNINDVIVSATDGTIGVYQGGGDGAFTQAKVLSISPSPFIQITNLSGLASANFNKSGTNDLVVTRFAAPGLIPNVGIGLDYDAVNQKLGKVKTANAGNEPASVVAPDLDGDGNADLLIANRVSNDVSFLSGKGDGSFNSPVSYPGLGGGLVSIAAGDFGNGKVSFAAAEPSGNRVDVFLNGTFATNPGFKPFADVPFGHTFYDYVKIVALKYNVKGFDCGLNSLEPCDAQNSQYFRPNSPVTLREAADWVSRASGKPAPPGTDQDVPATRAQVATLIMEAAGWNDFPQTQSFADVDPNNAAVYVPVERLRIHGITSGYACGSNSTEPCDANNRPYFRPFNNVTRGQLAKFVVQTFSGPFAPEMFTQPVQTGNIQLKFGSITLKLSVTSAGDISVQSLDGFNLPSQFALPAGYTIHNESLAFELQTSAALGGDQEVCVDLPLAVKQYQASHRVKLLHGENGVLVDRTTDDSTPGVVCAKVSSFSPFVLAIAPGLSHGDVDNNHAVDVSDAVIILQNIVGQATLDTDQNYAADVDNSGAVDVTDAVLILRAVAGIDAPIEP